MKNANPLPDAVVDNHLRFLVLLKDHVQDEATAERVLRKAYNLGREEASAPRDEDKIVPWFCRVVRGAMDGTAYRKEGIERNLKQTMGDAVTDLLDSLKTDQADLIRKAELGERSLKDMAHQARTSPEDVKSRLHRARESLKKKMLQSWGVCTLHVSMDCACHR